MPINQTNKNHPTVNQVTQMICLVQEKEEIRMNMAHSNYRIKASRCVTTPVKLIH